MNTGGAETFLMKMYRHLDRTQYQMDFCINTKEKCFYEDEIIMMGGKIFRIPEKTRSFRQFSKQLMQIVRTEKYEYVLRVTSNAMGFLDLKLAKQAGAKVCVARSSNSADGLGWKYKIANILGKIIFLNFVDVKIAPSDLAACYTFGKKQYRTGDVKILHNAVDTTVFRYDHLGRKCVRKELYVNPGTLLVGHVGRFDTQKNHTFLLDIFMAIRRRNPDVKLLLVGTGPLEREIRDKVEELGLQDRVIFAGVRSDIPQLLSAMDVLVFPSLYEGMPNSVIEAQSTGLPCVIANTITREADITGIVRYLSLEESADVWSDVAFTLVQEERRNITQSVIDHGYDTVAVVREFTSLIFGNHG